MRKVFPEHWSFMFGEIALYSFVVLLVTGIWLTLFFDPSMSETVYHGSYGPLHGVRMSQAYASTVHISFEVRGGLFIRQLHHWSALTMIGALCLHTLRHFLTGSFRKPREVNWLFGFTLLVLVTLEGFVGYSLPDDLLSGTGLRIAEGVTLAIPLVGTYLSMFLFGGEFPGHNVIGRFYGFHILLIPGIVVALLTVHLILVFYHKHTQFRGPARTEKNVVGQPLFPHYTAKAKAASSSSSPGCCPCWRASRRSTPCGRTAPTGPTRSPRAPSPTGTWASWKEPCGPCPPGSSASPATPSTSASSSPR